MQYICINKETFFILICTLFTGLCEWGSLFTEEYCCKDELINQGISVELLEATDICIKLKDTLFLI